MSPSDLLKSLEVLSGPARTILRLKALVGPATPKMAFLECLSRASVAAGGRPWVAKALNLELERLRSMHLLDDELACAPAIMHRLAIEALAAPEAGAMMDAIRAGMALKGLDRWYYDSKVAEPSSLRWMRLAILLNDEAEFKQAAAMRARFAPYAPDGLAKAFAGIVVGVEWLATRLPIFQFAILAAKADGLISAGIAAPDYAELMEHYRDACRRDPALLAVWPMVADADLLNGRLARLAEHIAARPAGTPEDMVAAFSAACALLGGDTGEALRRFADALRLHRKITRRRKAELPGLLGLLHLVAMIGADDAGLHAEIEAALDIKAPPLGHLAIRALLELSRSREMPAREIIRQAVGLLRQVQYPPPLSAALLAVAALLVDRTSAKEHAAQFIQLYRRVEPAASLIAGMLAEVLERVADDPAPYRAFLAKPEREVTLRFAGLIAGKEAWERALDTIEAMLAPARPAAAEAPAKARRLVWLVEPATGEIQPLEQTIQAHGWSAGRPVALKRLHRGDPKLDFLDDLDRRAIGTIQRSAGGWYDEEIFELPPEKSLSALVGHPRVYDANAPSTPVELVAGRVELVLSAEAAGFRLALSHEAHRPSAFIDIEAPGRWRVVTVDAKAVAAALVLGTEGISVPSTARDRLVALARTQMPGLPVRVEAVELEDGTVEEGSAAPVVRLAPVGDGLKVALVVRPFGPDGPNFLPGIGGRMVTAQIDGRFVRVRRDLDRERQEARRLAGSCASLGGDGPDWLLDDLVASLEFLAELQALAAPPALEWPEGQKLALHGEVSASRFKATVKGAEGWFAIGGTIAVDENLVLDLGDLLSRLDHGQGRFVPLANGGFIALDRHFRAQLERLKLLADGAKVPRLAAVSVRSLLEEAESLKADSRWKDFTHQVDDAEAWQPRLAAGFEAELRDYQTDGFAWLARLARWGAGACLADDMGLGKTVQAIAVMATLAPNGPCLVVAPTSVCGNWDAELARFAPALKPFRLAEAGDRGQTLDGLGPGDVVIASYGLLAREQDRLASITWAMAILDEGQAIKNADTRRAKASQRLVAGFRLMLTGTPVENDLDELWSLFRFVSPGLLGGRETFQRRFAIPIERDNDAGARAALKLLVRPFLLRRTKAMVLAELPARTEQTLLVEMSEEERAFYEALRRRALERLAEPGGERTRIHILAEITKLRRACCHPTLAVPDAGVPAAKLEVFMELVEELRLNRHRALVFSQFVGHLDKIRAALDGAGSTTYQYLDGATPAREREKRVAAFQAGDGDLFLISLKAGGFGLNLTAADYVIHLDPWWNPAVEDQASDRAHRIGQLRPVTIYRLIVKDSIEQGIVALHRRKRDLADALLEGADASGRLSEEDLLDLIRTGASLPPVSP